MYAATKQLQITIFMVLDDSGISFSRHLAYYEMYCEYDAFIIAPEPSNPWLSDSTDYWDTEKIG
jgi:hypothetical protein